jgi:hypothetical protein
MILYAIWFVAVYTILTAISLKETRQALMMLVPIAIAAALFVGKLSPGRMAAPLAVVVGISAFGWTVTQSPTPRITGYREAAERICEIAPPNARVVFNGNSDGAFVFNVRTLKRRDISVIRADKLFLNVSIMPSYGLNPNKMDEAQIVSLLDRLGVNYIITVPNLWAKAQIMENFATALKSDHFEVVDHIPVYGPVTYDELVIYRNRGPLKSPPDDFGIRLGVGIHISR